MESTVASKPSRVPQKPAALLAVYASSAEVSGSTRCGAAAKGSRPSWELLWGAAAAASLSRRQAAAAAGVSPLQQSPAIIRALRLFKATKRIREDICSTSSTRRVVCTSAPFKRNSTKHCKLLAVTPPEPLLLLLLLLRQADPNPYPPPRRRPSCIHRERAAALRSVRTPHA